jgi:hypothetical protein
VLSNRNSDRPPPLTRQKLIVGAARAFAGCLFRLEFALCVLVLLFLLISGLHWPSVLVRLTVPFGSASVPFLAGWSSQCSVRLSRRVILRGGLVLSSVWAWWCGGGCPCLSVGSLGRAVGLARYRVRLQGGCCLWVEHRAAVGRSLVPSWLVGASSPFFYRSLRWKLTYCITALSA